MSAHPVALVPSEDDAAAAPPGLAVAVYDADHAPPEHLDAVELYVVPYNRADAVDLLADLPALRAVVLLTAGYEHVLPHLPPGVALHNGAGLHDASTAELAMTLILAAQRDLDEWILGRAAAHWDRHLTRSLAGSRVLLVGYGGIGRALEARLAPFEVDVVRVASRAWSDARGAIHGIDELPDLLPGADVVVLAVPDTARTRGLIGATELALLADGALLVNVGRGTAVDTEALLAEKGRVRAALDVVDPEPFPPGHPLWTAPGMILTPHIGGGSATFEPRARAYVAEQLRRFAAGEPLLNPVEEDR
ncbi:2-hydroxyacid dehydrogenase [Spongisporangium articulatum]|uniref:2-hydroxyacid dehydrogenase n=1 Tax=Spongisporangium articulatum TaxID=3362603 RepID=A0ABW8AH12_9ACTN